VFKLVETARHVRTYVDQVAREHGITRAQWGLLSRLRRMEGASQIDLARDMELSPIALARVADRLAGQGLVERRADPSDRRVNRLYLTQAGHHLVADFDPLRAKIAEKVLAGLSVAEIEQAISVLNTIAGNVRPAGHGAPEQAPVAALAPRRPSEDDELQSTADDLLAGPLPT
jgi:DNA-binding MarR family transcriptional regulator